MAQHLRVLTAFEEALGFVPNTHVAPENFSSWESNALFWPPQVPVCM